MRGIFYVLLLLITACSATIDDYHGMKPALDLRQFFNGRVTAWGQVQDRSGKIIKRFTVDMTGTWKGSEGTLEEHFQYDDGTKQTRIWHLTALPDGRYIGRADDVVGEARGQVQGPALKWSYTLALPVNGKTWHVTFDDWMYLHDANTMMNRAEMSKFGVRLGEITLFFRKTEPQS